jgi:hypothetical protein
MKYFFTLILSTIYFVVICQTPKTIKVRGVSSIEINPEKIDLLIVYRYSDNLKDNQKTLQQEIKLYEVLSLFEIQKKDLVLDNLTATGWGGLYKVENNSVTISKSYRLTISNLNIIDSLIYKLIKTGADNVTIVNLENSKLEEYKQVAINKALENAKLKAQTISSNLGVNLSNPISVIEIFPTKTIQNNDSRQYYDKVGNTINGRSNFQDFDIETLNMRKIKIYSTFDVEYEIK